MTFRLSALHINSIPTDSVFFFFFFFFFFVKNKADDKRRGDEYTFRGDDLVKSVLCFISLLKEAYFKRFKRTGFLPFNIGPFSERALGAEKANRKTGSQKSYLL